MSGKVNSDKVSTTRRKKPLKKTGTKSDFRYSKEQLEVFDHVKRWTTIIEEGVENIKNVIATYQSLGREQPEDRLGLINEYEGYVIQDLKSLLFGFEIHTLTTNLYSPIDLLATKEYRAAKRLIEVWSDRFLQVMKLYKEEGYSSKIDFGNAISSPIREKDNWKGTPGQLGLLLKGLEEKGLIGPKFMAFGAAHITVKGKDVTSSRLSSDATKVAGKSKPQIERVLNSLKSVTE